MESALRLDDLVRILETFRGLDYGQKRKTFTDLLKVENRHSLKFENQFRKLG